MVVGKVMPVNFVDGRCEGNAVNFVDGRCGGNAVNFVDGRCEGNAVNFVDGRCEGNAVNFVDGRCGGDEKNERPRRTDKSRTLKKQKQKRMKVSPTDKTLLKWLYIF